METLVYECYLEDSVTFKSFRDMSDLEKLQLMMEKVREGAREGGLVRGQGKKGQNGSKGKWS